MKLNLKKAKKNALFNRICKNPNPRFIKPKDQAVIAKIIIK